MDDLDNVIETTAEEVAHEPAGEIEQGEAATENTPEPEKAAATAEAGGEEKSGIEKLIAAKTATPLVEGEAPAEAFKPNVKIKVLDKEIEIPKEYHGLMKDKASEKAVREVFEKAHGLDTVKPKYQDLKTRYQEMAPKYETLNSAVEDLRNTYQSAVGGPGRPGNILKLDDFFAKMQVPEEVVLQWAYAKAQLMEMPEDQRKLVEGQRNAERQADLYKQNSEAHQNELVRQANQLKQIQLDTALMRDEVKTFASDFDARAGQAGAFREEVRRQGQMAWVNEKVDLTPEQAIERAIKFYKPFIQQQTPATESAPNVADGKKVVVKPSGQKVIPNIQGKGTSPLKTKPKSIEDLKKLAQSY